ncbi:MAG: DUF3472 domain-containing protein [Planctomycetia bacterium]|nr:DUF3472 domain-containing protein [Planctomycetia bacterium]
MKPPTALAIAILTAAALQTCAASQAQAQHLWWDLGGQKDATCLYGEITVLATHKTIYYCGANWHPGSPAGGYCGIQDNSAQEKRMIFSIWDTSPKLKPKVTEAGAATKFSRFANEGSGAHTHQVWPWKVGETFQFFVEKRPGTAADTTDARFYYFDKSQNKWQHGATINCPNGGQASVPTFGGAIVSFLENFSGRDRDVPKLALYRLWLGPSPDKLKCLTRAGGDGNWGQLHDCYYLAEGEKTRLAEVFSGLEKTYGKSAPAGQVNLKPISDKPLPPQVIEGLKQLPRAPGTS